MPKQSALIANIRFYCALIGMKQKDLEEALGISRATYKRRADTENFTISDLRIIARKLHVQVTDLLKGI